MIFVLHLHEELVSKHGTNARDCHLFLNMRLEEEVILKVQRVTVHLNY